MPNFRPWIFRMGFRRGCELLSGKVAGSNPVGGVFISAIGRARWPVGPRDIGGRRANKAKGK